MIEIENVMICGTEPAMRGMRNPKNSWDKSDSGYCRILSEMTFPCEEKCIGCPMWTGADDALIEKDGSYNELEKQATQCGMLQQMGIWDGYVIGPNDHELAMKLAHGGPVHAKYRRMMIVYADITAPLYWWKEFDTYKVGTVANSCSTMHKIHAKEFTLDDFSHEHLIDGDSFYFLKNRDPLGRLKETIEELNFWRLCFTDKEAALHGAILYNADGKEMDKKDYWWQMIQLLPSSYNQKRTVMFSYEMLAGTDMWRADHKQDEWRAFCKWARTLPYSEFFWERESRI